MSLTLTCRCGTRFEVEETFAGQEVTCPQCQTPVKAPAAAPGAIRTCDFAIASLVLALVGAFTIVGTLAAVVLGIVAIMRIQRHRQRLAGMGFAVAGIAFGVLFTALTTLAVTTGEIFGIGEQLRQRQLAGRVRDDPDLEIEQKGVDAFSISRASHDWVVAKDDLKAELQWEDRALVLVNKRREATIDLEAGGLSFMSAEAVADQTLEQYRHQGRGDSETVFPKVSDVKLRQKLNLPTKDGDQRVDLLMDMRVLGQPWTVLVRVVKTPNGHIFVLTARAPVRVFKQLENEIRRMMDSFEPG
jgi:hypothetical protein